MNHCECNWCLYLAWQFRMTGLILTGQDMFLRMCLHYTMYVYSVYVFWGGPLRSPPGYIPSVGRFAAPTVCIIYVCIHIDYLYCTCSVYIIYICCRAVYKRKMYSMVACTNDMVKISSMPWHSIFWKHRSQSIGAWVSVFGWAHSKLTVGSQ